MRGGFINGYYNKKKTEKQKKKKTDIGFILIKIIVKEWQIL